MTELWEMTQQNQWWENSNAIDNDPKILSFEGSKAKWYPAAYYEISFDAPAIYIVKGVRQIGKSTLLKLLLKKLIAGGVHPRALFYFSFDNLSDYKQIAGLAKKYLDLVTPHKFERHYLFFDEVTLVKNWQQGIKYASDIGLFRDSVVVLSGSSAVDLKYSSERLPGRRGGGSELNKLMLPISFGEFLKLKGVDVTPISLDEILSGDFHRLDKLKAEVSSLQKNFVEYAAVGGVPAVLDRYLKTTTCDDRFLADTYADVFFSTMGKLGRNRTTLLQIVRRLVQLNFARFSWQSFTSEIDVGSFHTTLEYLEHMADSYFIGLLYFLDHGKMAIRSKKEKKIYVTDPVFFKLFLALSGMDAAPYLTRDDRFGLYAESIVYAHLVRLFMRQAFDGLSSLQNISYWYSEKQKEIDFLVTEGERVFPIEVKYQRAINASDYLGMKRVFNKGLLLTREGFFQDGNVSGVPLPVFLAAIP